MSVPALDLRRIVKTFGGLRANDGVDLTVEWGEVHALLGENGAGKSTLMNVVYGVVSLDSGEIRFDGKPVRIHGPTDAIRLGIGMVHQHFMLVPVMTVAENVVLGSEPGRFVLDARQAAATVRELSDRYGLEVDPDSRVEDLPVGLQQRVEIIKALYRGARLLVLDEPTAVLTPQEIRRLFEIVRQIRSEGHSVVFISHKLHEVREIADRVTVMRRGKVVASTTPAESSAEDLARLMVGRPVLLRVEKGPASPGEAVLEVSGLVVEDDRHQVAVDELTLEVRAGEILGVAGVDGNGQAELVEAVVGVRPARAGTVHLLGRDLTHLPTHERLAAGIAHIPADRHRMGVVSEMPVFDNLVLSGYDRRPYARRGIRDLRAVRARAAELMRTFDIRAAGPGERTGALSGGNQQKVVVARELSGTPRLLIAAQPTRGIDVGSIEFIHRRLVEQRDAGLGVLLVSSELDEVLALADRVAVIYRGRLVAVLEGAAIDRDRIGLLMAGAA